MPIRGFSNDCGKTNTKVITATITTRANNAMNQSEFLAIICNLFKARENSRAQGAIGSNLVLHGFGFGFGFGFCRLENLFTPVNIYSDCTITVIRTEDYAFQQN